MAATPRPVAKPSANHPVIARLLAPAAAFSRHVLLHELERELNADAPAALASRVRHFVERGVPYFAPADAHYRAWAERAAALWDEVHATPLAAA